MYPGHDLDISGHVTSSVTWPMDSLYTISNTCSFGTETLSPMAFEILRHKCIGVTTLTFGVTWRHRSRDHSTRSMWFPIGLPLSLTVISNYFRDIKPEIYPDHDLDLSGHVTSSVTWPIDSLYTISYTYSFGTETLSPMAFEILRHKCIGVTTLTFGVTWRHRSREHSTRSMWFPIGLPLSLTVISNYFRDIKPEMYPGHDLDLSGHVTSSVTWPMDSLYTISYRCSFGTETISNGFRDIKAQMYRGHDLDLWGHVTSSITWPFDSQYVISYRAFIDTNPLSWTIFEILSLKCIRVMTLTFQVTWRHQSRDQSTRYILFPAGAPSEPRLHLQRFSRY